MTEKSRNSFPKAPVMILFFNRPDNLQQVFNAVREYKPERLFLVQDGARSSRPDDKLNIQKCRGVVSNVDWPCEVKTNYSEENMTCDHREYTGISWCFQFVDRLIILEDDCVPTQSFFHLCEENLELYKDNTQIHSIYGFNRVGKYTTPYDHVFSSTGAGWGWATWKRVWSQVETICNLSFFDDEKLIEYIKKVTDKNIFLNYGDFIEQGRRVRKTNKLTNRNSSWEYVTGIVLILNNMLTICPAVNMVKYIGISENATHTPASPSLLPYKKKKVLLQPAFDIDFKNIKHPPFVIKDCRFESFSRKSMSTPRLVSKIEVMFRKILFALHILK